MPSEASAVGALQLPVASATAGTALPDPVLDGLIDFAAWYIKNALDTRLATVKPAGLITDACPTTNRYAFNPTDPEGVEIRLFLPAMFMWWTGKSKLVDFTTMHSFRVRTVGLLYVYEELPNITSKVERVAWGNVVDAALWKMSYRTRHASYTPSGGAPGMPLSQALADLGVIDWKFLGSEHGRFGIGEGPSAAKRSKKTSGRDHPAVKGDFEVWERIEAETNVDPDDVLADGLMTFNVNGEGDGAVELMQRVFDAPDGSEDL